MSEFEVGTLGMDPEQALVADEPAPVMVVAPAGRHTFDRKSGLLFWTERQGEHDLVWLCDDDGQPIQFFTRRRVAPPGTHTEPRSGARRRVPGGAGHD